MKKEMWLEKERERQSTTVRKAIPPSVTCCQMDNSRNCNQFDERKRYNEIETELKRSVGEEGRRRERMNPQEKNRVENENRFDERQ